VGFGVFSLLARVPVGIFQQGLDDRPIELYATLRIGLMTLKLIKTVKPLSAPLRLLRQELPVLTNLRLAIVLLLMIAISITGTVIEQGQSVEFYQANYPEHCRVWFLSWKVLLTLGLDHVYRTWWF